MSGFSPAWLRQREPLDAAARARALAERFAGVLGRPVARPIRIVDLAAGSGANMRALGPLIDADQDWLLLDDDPEVITAQSDELARWARAAGWGVFDRDAGMTIDAGGAGCWHAAARRIDLNRSLDAIDWAAFDGVTTSAFLDLVSATWLDRFCTLLAKCRRPFLAALTVDGRRAWHPSAPGDEHVSAAFARHQCGDKGFDAALGPAAARALVARLTEHGYDVVQATSDWRLGPRDAEVLELLIDETVRAASQAQPRDALAFATWRNLRKAQLAAGALSLRVGHLDVLAVHGAHRSPRDGAGDAPLTTRR